jgi:hypothetical protein
VNRALAQHCFKMPHTNKRYVACCPSCTLCLEAIKHKGQYVHEIDHVSAKFNPGAANLPVYVSVDTRTAPYQATHTQSRSVDS